MIAEKSTKDRGIAETSAGIMDYPSDVWKRPKVMLSGHTTARKMAVGIDSLLRIWCFWLGKACVGLIVCSEGIPLDLEAWP